MGKSVPRGNFNQSREGAYTKHRTSEFPEGRMPTDHLGKIEREGLIRRLNKDLS